jgi:hypothetical protein
MGTPQQRLEARDVPVKQNRQFALPPRCDGESDAFAFVTSVYRVSFAIPPG